MISSCPLLPVRMGGARLDQPREVGDQLERFVDMNTQTISTHVIPDDLLAIQNPRILMLEDDHDLAQALVDLLGTEGFEVTHCHNGAEGLKALLNREFHVLLCDMVMPAFPGDMFYRAVRQIRPELCERFIFMTGHRTDRKIDQFIRTVRGLMLWKPFAAHELLRAVQHVLRKVQDRCIQEVRDRHEAGAEDPKLVAARQASSWSVAHGRRSDRRTPPTRWRAFTA